MATNNILQSVQTYQDSGLALLQNSVCWFKNANTKFKDFEKLTGNLGDTVTFDKVPKSVSKDGLVVEFQESEQRVQSLTVDRAKNVARAFTAQQQIFNLDANNYMQKFGKSDIAELASVIESDIAEVAIENTYRFYGDGRTPINSYTQLAKALALFRNIGTAKNDTKGFIPDIAVPDIIGTGLNQFAANRNNEDANSWELGPFSKCDWFSSNLLATHYAGNVGEDDLTLTVVSISNDGTQITFDGAANDDASAIKEGDLLQFQDGVGSYTNLRFLTFFGHHVSQSPVQIRATADAESNGSGRVVVEISPALISTAGSQNQNINTPVVAGMQAKALPSHRAGLIYSGNPLYIAMPQLPDEAPFATAYQADPDTGIALRMYYGSAFGQNQRGMVHDCIWGRTLVDEYALRVIFPM
jgi:hypothetical protein